MRISDWSSDVCSSDRIVPGGGTALLYATKVLEGMKGVNEDKTRGIDIVRKSLQAQLRQIAQNAGHDGALVAGKTRKSVVEGKAVSFREELGGRGSSEKKTE